MSFILWLAKKNRLLTLDKISFLNKGVLYPFFTNEAESHAHLFFSCRMSLRVCAHIRDWIPLHKQTISMQHTISSFISSRATSGARGGFRFLALATTVYSMWMSRNKLLFENYQFSITEIINKIKFFVYRQSHLLHRC